MSNKEVAQILREELVERFYLIGALVNPDKAESIDHEVDTVVCDSVRLCERLAGSLETGEVPEPGPSDLSEPQFNAEVLKRLSEGYDLVPHRELGLLAKELAPGKGKSLEVPQRESQIDEQDAKAASFDEFPLTKEEGDLFVQRGNEAVWALRNKIRPPGRVSENEEPGATEQPPTESAPQEPRLEIARILRERISKRLYLISELAETSTDQEITDVAIDTAELVGTVAECLETGTMPEHESELVDQGLVARCLRRLAEQDMLDLSSAKLLARELAGKWDPKPPAEGASA